MTNLLMLGAVLFVWPLVGNAFVPWDATYNSSTRTSAAWVTNYSPNSGTWQKTMEGYRGSFSGSVPGPLGPAGVAGSVAVSEAAAISLLSKLTYGMAIVSMGVAAWEVYKAYGASADEGGFPVVYASTDSAYIQYKGVNYVSASLAFEAAKSDQEKDAFCAGGSATRCQNDAAWVGRRCVLVEWRMSTIPLQWFSVEKCPQGPTKFDAGEWQWEWGLPTENRQRTFTLSVQNVVKDQKSLADLESLWRRRAATEAAVDASNALQKPPAPLKFDSPAKVGFSTIPAPQSSPWSQKPDGTSEREVWTPRLVPDGTIRWDRSVEKKAADGTVISSPDPSSSGDPVSAEPAKTDCDKLPNSVGCTDLGEAPTDAVPSVTRDVALNPENISLPSGCPAPVPMPGGNQLSYAAACQTADTLRPLVIACGVLAAGLICLAAIRR